ncbi:MAG: hypothetical protein V7739_04900 [Motiliproteus sp.]
MTSSASDFLHNNVRVLKSRVSKTAFHGVLVAIAAIIIATLASSYIHHGTISAAGIIDVQLNNYALWVLDAIPFVFGLWGQYSSTIIAYEASDREVSKQRRS